MNRNGDLPGEEEQFEAYREAVLALRGLPVTIRTVDVGADKPWIA
jgi:phosphotransferase system enzyme I (PtsI)